MLGLGLDYGLGFSSDTRIRQDPQLRLSHLATIFYCVYISRNDRVGGLNIRDLKIYDAARSTTRPSKC